MICQLGAQHTEGVSSLNFCNSGAVLCSTSLDCTVALWDVRDTQKPTNQVLKAHSEPVNCAAFHPGNETSFFTGSDDAAVLVWDMRNLAAPCAKLMGIRDGVNRILVSSDGQRTFCAADDGCVYVHNLVTAQSIPLVDKWMVSDKTCNDISIVPSAYGDIIISCSEDGALRSWTSSTSMSVPNAEADADPDSAVSAEAVQQIVTDAAQEVMVEERGAAAAADDDDAAPSAVAMSGADLTDRMLMSFDQFESPVNHCAVYGGVLYVACAETVFGITLDPRGNGQLNGEVEITAFAGHEDYVRGMHMYGGGAAASPSTTMYTVSDDSTVIEWDRSNQTATRRVKAHDTMIMASALFGDVLATGSEDCSIRLWKLPFQTERLA